MATLVVIDMQPETWSCARTEKSVVRRIKKEIAATRASRCPVVFLEYESCGSTNEELLEMVEGYKRTATAVKYAPSGAQLLIDVAKRRRFGLQHIKVCGILSDCCVALTVEGLAKRLPKSRIEIITKGCWPQYSQAWTNIKRSRDNVAINRYGHRKAS